MFSFEKELKNKLQAKSSGVQSEEQVLIKSFKYFDLNNNETVEPDEFAKAIEKIGIMIPTKQVSNKFGSQTQLQYLEFSKLFPNDYPALFFKNISYINSFQLNLGS